MTIISLHYSSDRRWRLQKAEKMMDSIWKRPWPDYYFIYDECETGGQCSLASLCAYLKRKSGRGTGYVVHKHKNVAIAPTPPPTTPSCFSSALEYVQGGTKSSIHWACLLFDLKPHLWQLGLCCHKPVPFPAWLETIYQVIILNYGMENFIGLEFVCRT